MTDEFIAWKASQARPWAENVRATVGRLQQREAALNELISLYDGMRAQRYDRNGGKATPITGDEQMAALVSRLDAMREGWAQALSEWREEVSAFEYALRRIEPRYDQLLTARYLRGLKWADVAKELTLDEDYLRTHLATEALAALFDAMPPHLRAIPQAFEE